MYLAPFVQVRAKAKDWKLAPDRIGVMGSSAGGHLTSTIVAHFDYGSKQGDAIDRVSSRPDLAVLCYPVSTLGNIRTWGRRNLLGEKPSPELVKLLSNELQVQRIRRPVSYGIRGRMARCQWRTVCFYTRRSDGRGCACHCTFTRQAGMVSDWGEWIMRNSIRGLTRMFWFKQPKFIR